MDERKGKKEEKGREKEKERNDEASESVGLKDMSFDLFSSILDLSVQKLW